MLLKSVFKSCCQEDQQSIDCGEFPKNQDLGLLRGEAITKKRMRSEFMKSTELTSSGNSPMFRFISMLYTRNPYTWQ